MDTPIVEVKPLTSKQFNKLCQEISGRVIIKLPEYKPQLIRKVVRKIMPIVLEHDKTLQFLAGLEERH